MSNDQAADALLGFIKRRQAVEAAKKFEEPSAEALEVADPLAGLSGAGVKGKWRIAQALDAFAVRKVAEADDPQWDGTDAAHPAWWRGNDRGVAVITQMLTDALDGKDDGHGVINHTPLEALRRRLLTIADHREVLPP